MHIVYVYRDILSEPLANLGCHTEAVVNTPVQNEPLRVLSMCVKKKIFCCYSHIFCLHVRNNNKQMEN